MVFFIHELRSGDASAHALLNYNWAENRGRINESKLNLRELPTRVGYIRHPDDTARRC